MPYQRNCDTFFGFIEKYNVFLLHPLYEEGFSHVTDLLTVQLKCVKYDMLVTDKPGIPTPIIPWL